MDISINKTNFQSKIKVINYEQFKQKTKTLNFSRCEVTYPWTIETMKIGQKLYSTGFLDCLGFVATNGVESAVGHLATRSEELAEYEGIKHFDIKNIEQVLLSKFDLKDEDVHCILFGAREENKQYLEQLKKLFEKYKKPFSVIGHRKDISGRDTYSIFIDTPADIFYISNNMADKKTYDSKSFLENRFNEVSLCNLDEWA